MKGGKSAVLGLISIAVFTFILFYVLKGFWAFASFFAWGFLIVAAIANYQVILDYGKRMLDLFKRNPLYGIGGLAFTVFLYPIVFFVLMLRALGGKVLTNAGFNTANMGQGEEETFTDYEEVEDEVLELEKIEVKEREYR